jgi:hypothetical protein
MPDPAFDANDPRLRPVPPGQFSWKTIPSSKAEDDIVKVFMIPSSDLDSPKNILIDDPADSSRMRIPSFSFLVQHEKYGTTLLWDLGLTKVSQYSSDSYDNLIDLSARRMKKSLLRSYASLTCNYYASRATY